MEQDIRWQQRFENFGKALEHLNKALLKNDLSDLEKAGVIQIYEFTFELAWKTMKDFLESKQAIAKYPQDVIKEAFAYEIITDSDLWMDMLEKRNLMAHTYNETNADIAFNLIATQYINALRQAYNKLKSGL